VRALGAIATRQVYVARGAAIAALYSKAKPWDIAAAHAILSAVGGTAIYLDGVPLSVQEVLAQGGTTGPVLAGHPEVVEKLLPKIRIRHQRGPQRSGD
jgi:fructose-1,6-bisphosphatase/inositol monophosphatase family enzyme